MGPSKKAFELVGDARRYAMIRLDGEEPRQVYAFQDKHIAEAIDEIARAAAEAMRERCLEAGNSADVLSAMNESMLFGVDEHAIVFRDPEATRIWMKHMAAAVERARTCAVDAIRALPLEEA